MWVKKYARSQRENSRQKNIVMNAIANNVFNYEGNKMARLFKIYVMLNDMSNRWTVDNSH